jgi:hypothetical protein
VSQTVATDAADSQTSLAKMRDIENDRTTDTGNVGWTIRLLHDHRTATSGDLHCSVEGRNVDRAAYTTRSKTGLARQFAQYVIINPHKIWTERLVLRLYDETDGCLLNLSLRHTRSDLIRADRTT